MVFVYIHLLFQWKVSNEIDIPHVMKPSKEQLERIADTKQPFIFENPVESSLHLEGGNKNVNIKKMNETPVRVPHRGMLSAVKKEPYLSEGNGDFLEELEWDASWDEVDTYLRPPMNLWCYHDILYGNHSVYTELKEALNSRNYIVALEGDIEIKLSPPESMGHGVDVWVSSQKTVSTILIPLKKGSVLHVPAYWWWSARMPGFSSVLLLSYSTYMNAFSLIPNKISKLIQNNKIEV